MRRRFLLALFLLCPAPLYAQVIAITPNALGQFVSADHTTLTPAGQTNAGQPVISGYQFSVFPASADVTTGVPISVSTVIPKANVALVPSTTPQQYSVTFAAMGFLSGPQAIPACTTLPCPQYTMLVVAIGPNGTSAKAVTAESNPFTAALPVQGPPPAGPTNVTVKP